MESGASNNEHSANSEYSDYGPLRILRVVDGNGEDAKTEDFEVNRDIKMVLIAMQLIKIRFLRFS